MDNEVSCHRKCVNSCPYTPEDNISSSLTSSSNDSHSSDLETLPILEDYETPVPYTFRINIPSRTSEARTVTCPPFYLQLDHTIAVIWQLFDTDKDENKDLGISQLQWALYFLKAIKDPTEGVRSPDIELAKTAIEDALLECYADMASLVMRSPPPQGIPCIICNLERNIPKSTCHVCTSASWGLLGRPRKTGRKEQDNSNNDFNFSKYKIQNNYSSSMPSEPVVQHQQTDEQLKNEIEQLKNLALSLSTSKAGDFKRKKVRVKSFTVLGRTNN